jgi:ferric-dicitrate binding protein FerR (iron transport regulator)
MEKKNIEYFIFDETLRKIAEENSIDKLEAYKNEHAGDEKIIEQAVTLLQNLKIDYYDVPREQIEEDYKRLFAEIRARSRKRIGLWRSAVAAAACVAILVGLSTILKFQEKTDYQQQAISMLDSLDNNVDEIRIISGTQQIAVIDNNAKIEQTEDGNILVGEEEKVKSDALKTEWLQLVVPFGKRTSIRFHDGTMAWLNAGTKLVYPKTFAKEKREIFIEGEIYLEVGKDKSRPFYVHAKHFDVNVLGTKFNMSAYTDDTENSVVLVEGSVEIATTVEKRKLSPNQGFFQKEGSAEIRTVDTYAYTCWKDGIMKVNNEPLENMLARLSRHYNVKIRCDDHNILHDRYKGKLNLNESLETVLYNLSLSTPFDYSEGDENTVVLKQVKN